MQRRSFLAASLAAVGARSAPETDTRIAYVLADGVWIRDFPDGKPRRVVAGAKLAAPRISPSGQWLSYLQSGDLHVAAMDGRSDRALGKSVTDSQWWPKRDALLVPAPEGFAIFTPADWSTPVRRLFFSMLPAVFSPDGNDFVYADEAPPGHGHMEDPVRIGRLWRVAGHGDPKLVIAEESARPIPAVWGPSGILYWEDPDFSASIMADGLELFQVPVSGGEAKSLGISALVNPDALALDRAGARLAISAGSGRNEWEGKRIAAIDLKTGAISWITDAAVSAVWPAWSPDGRSIAYSAAASGDAGGGPPAQNLLAKRKIWIADANGPGRRQVTRDEAYRDESPVFSADGQFIVFCRMDGAGGKSLWTMKTDGTSLRQLAGPLYADDGGWFGYYGHIDWRGMWDRR